MPRLKLLTVKEIAEILGVSEQFIYNNQCKLSDEGLGISKIGRSLRVAPETIDTYLKRTRR